MVAKFNTIKKHLNHNIICEDFGDSAVVMCEECDVEIVVEDEESVNYSELAKHAGHNLKIVEQNQSLIVLCTDCDKVIADIKLGDTKDAGDIVEDGDLAFDKL